MNFIIFDLELNQDFSSSDNFDGKISSFPFEIIQIGAVKLDKDLKTMATFNRFVKPTIYQKISPFIASLTGITTEQLIKEEPFPAVYQSYAEFIGGADSIFCIWGMSDIKEIFNNVKYHHINPELLPKRYLNLQPFMASHFNLPKKTMLRLQHAVELLRIPMTQPFHDAFHDAYYTTQVFKKIYHPSMEPKLYDPSHIRIRPKLQKRGIDFDQLIKQFEKMYAREMTAEEQSMISLAYKMGRTNQFLK